MATDAQPPTQISQAVAVLASDPARAERLAREVLSTTPGDPDALVVLGTALRVRGELAAARAVLEPLAAIQTGSWVVQFELARALLALGQSRAAIAPLSRTVALNPGLAAGWRMLGDVALFSGQVAAAQTAYDRALRALIDDPRLQGPADALAAGRPDAAERDLRIVLARDPNALAAGQLLAEALARQGRLADAEGLLAQCVERAPDFDLVRQSLAAVLLRSGKPAQALVQLDGLGAADNRSRMMRAAALTELGDYGLAAEVTEALLKDFPDQPHGWLLHGNGLRTLGRIDQAVAAYGKSIELDPAGSDAWWALANLKTYRFTPEMRATMRLRLADPALGPQDRSNLHFTFGKAEEDDGRYAEAFAHYAKGNAIQRGLRAYDPAETTAFVQRSKALFTPAFFAERKAWGSKAVDPIFIVGLPRSGSTLVDQILASHPLVEGTRELQDIQVIADWIAATERGAYPDQLASLPEALAAKLGGDYLDWAAPLRWLGRARFTDKAPWNFLHIGLIHLILPNAKIVDVRRHPLACCLSAFKQHFAQGWDFSYDLANLGRYYADYVALMAHYDAVLPDRVHRVTYEALVADTETEVRRLLNYAGLDFDPACLRFFDNPRAVATPSSEQVRQPIFSDAVDHWRGFEPWLGPLKAALGPVLDAYPSPP